LFDTRRPGLEAWTGGRKCKSVVYPVDTGVTSGHTVGGVAERVNQTVGTLCPTGNVGSSKMAGVTHVPAGVETEFAYGDCHFTIRNHLG